MLLRLVPLRSPGPGREALAVGPGRPRLVRANGGGVPDSTSHKPLLSLNRDRRRRTAWCMTVTLVTPTPPRPRFESLSCPAAKPTLTSDAGGWHWRLTVTRTARLSLRRSAHLPHGTGDELESCRVYLR